MKFAWLATQLDGVGPMRPSGWCDARCPGHPDECASLGIKVSAQDDVLALKCHAGCSRERILTALGLAPEAWKRSESWRNGAEIEDAYDYEDERGQLLFQVVRFKHPKKFLQRRPDPTKPGGWTYSIAGVRMVLYHLTSRARRASTSPRARRMSRPSPIWGSRHDVPHGRGEVAPQRRPAPRGRGAARRDPARPRPARRGPGADRRPELSRGGLTVRIVRLPGLAPKGDVSDWIAAGHTAAELTALVEATPLDTGEAARPTAPSEDASSEDAKPKDLLAGDISNAAKLVAAHGQDFRYGKQYGWLRWDGRRWALDVTDEIVQRAKTVARALLLRLADPTLDKDTIKRILRSQDAAKLAAMVRGAQSEPPIPVRAEQADIEPRPLTRGHEPIQPVKDRPRIRPHRREDYLMKLAPVVYDPTAQCPQYLAFLRRIFNKDQALIDFVQRLGGYCLTGKTDERVVVLLYGTGHNGKTTLLETWKGLLGDYAVATPISTLMVKRGEGIPNDVARLQGARLVIATEGEQGQRLAESLVKRLTGGDTLVASYLFKEWFEFEPQFKILIATIQARHPRHGQRHLGTRATGALLGGDPREGAAPPVPRHPAPRGRPRHLELDARGLRDVAARRARAAARRPHGHRDLPAGDGSARDVLGGPVRRRAGRHRARRGSLPRLRALVRGREPAPDVADDVRDRAGRARVPPGPVPYPAHAGGAMPAGRVAEVGRDEASMAQRVGARSRRVGRVPTGPDRGAAAVLNAARRKGRVRAPQLSR
jgi:hypothetical protein